MSNFIDSLPLLLEILGNMCIVIITFPVDVIKNFEIKLSFFLPFFKLLFGCPTANFGPLSWRQPHSTDINHLLFTYSTRRSQGASWGWVPKPGRAPSGVWTWNFRIWSQRLNPLGHSHSPYLAVFLYDQLRLRSGALGCLKQVIFDLIHKV